ncbi:MULTISPECIES: hypothetical protein [Brachyspira]|uniref:hypothetical protein n=1 Tax=Brachyspira TaxID=29521 RepID=UPI00063D9308|nr:MULTISPECIES: hypothetical protein [Brachyspira]KLI61679.1 hypothetical protein SZ44_00140 [Brachyspira hyodysenteriae]PCG18926.1 hypothetical protein KQ44_01815 [Brachyspira sp. G79]
MIKIFIFTAIIIFNTFLCYAITVDKKIADAYLKSYYPEDNNKNASSVADIYYVYNENKTNTIVLEGEYIAEIDNGTVDINMLFYPNIKLTESVNEVHFFNNDFLVTFSASYMKHSNYLLIMELNLILFNSFEKQKIISMFKNGGVQIMYNFNGKTYKYPIDDETSNLIGQLIIGTHSKL